MPPASSSPRSSDLIVDGAMTVVEKAAAEREISELRAFESSMVPIDFGHGAGPRICSQCREEAFYEAAIEGRVVGNNEACPSEGGDEIGGAHVRTAGPNAHPVCRPRLEKKQK